MRKLYFILLSLILPCCQSQESSSSTLDPSIETETKAATYDAEKALEYGADEYGMKKYVFAFLKKGPNRTLDSLEAQRLQMAHLENIMKMAEAGQLVLAGPFMDSGDIRGIYIFNVETLAEADSLTRTDPAIQAGSLVMELKEWYGSAALMAVNEIHGSLQKRGIVE